MKALKITQDLEPFPFWVKENNLGLLNSEYKQSARTNFSQYSYNKLFSCRSRIETRLFVKTSDTATILRVILFFLVFIFLFN